MGESTVITERETEVIEKRLSPDDVPLGDVSSDDIIFQEAAVVDDEAMLAGAAPEAAAMPPEADVHEATLATVNGVAADIEIAGVEIADIEIADDGDAALDNRDIADDAVASDEPSLKQAVRPIQAGLRPGLRAGLAR